MVNTQDKTYIFRKFFGFDVASLIHQFRSIIDFPNVELYFYETDLFRLVDNLNHWVDFYTKWLCNLDSIENVFIKFIDDVHLNLKDIYDTSSDTLKKQLDRAMALNTKEHVREAFSLGIVKSAFSDED